MRPLEIEAWVLRIADQVSRRQHVEDSLVELKAAWPKPADAARRIAAHANAARGAPILWVVGLDEVRGACGADPNELADWYASVRSQFNHVYPQVQDLNVRIGDMTVVALLFHTERAPFLVKNSVFGSPGGGPVEWETPWREGRKTRSATREDLIRMLTPLASLPQFECLECTLSARDEKGQHGDVRRMWYATGSLYVVPSGTDAVVIPFHRCRLIANLPAGSMINSWSEFRLSPPYRFSVSGRGGISSAVDSLTVESSSSEVIIAGPGRIRFSASTTNPSEPGPIGAGASLTLTMNPVGALTPSVVNIDLLPAKAGGDTKAMWQYGEKTF